MASVKFEIFITYSQIAIFDPELEIPFNDWTQQHSEQGFSWRPGSVSFGTLVDGGEMDVEIYIGTEKELYSATKRAIVVPFLVLDSGVIEVASISDSKIIEIPSGNYALLFETGFDEENDNKPWCKFSFTKKEKVEPKILRADDELKPIYPLLMEAIPAT